MFCIKIKSQENDLIYLKLQDVESCIPTFSVSQTAFSKLNMKTKIAMTSSVY